MTDDNFLASQYALGLLSTEEKQAIERTAEFEQTLQEWQLHLTKLNTQAPLEKKSAARIWQNIHAEVKQEASTNRSNIVRSWFNSWRYALSGFATLGLMLSIGLFNQNVHAKSGWDIQTDLSKQQLVIAITSHKHPSLNIECNLWVKRGNKVLYIGLMPETGQATFNITQEMLAMIEEGELIISLEKESQPIRPSFIDYQHKWMG